jgi:hypothetical protein
MVHWTEILKSAWHVLWVLAAYSYVVCSIVGARAAWQARRAGAHGLDMKQVDGSLEKFITSPFYVGTMFSLLSVLLLSQGKEIMRSAPKYGALNVMAIGLVVLAGTILIEVLESTVFRRDPLRMLGDKDAIRLSGVSLVVMAITSVVAGITS